MVALQWKTNRNDLHTPHSVYMRMKLRDFEVTVIFSTTGASRGLFATAELLVKPAIMLIVTSLRLTVH